MPAVVKNEGWVRRRFSVGEGIMGKNLKFKLVQFLVWALLAVCITPGASMAMDGDSSLAAARREFSSLRDYSIEAIQQLNGLDDIKLANQFAEGILKGISQRSQGLLNNYEHICGILAMHQVLQGECRTRVETVLESLGERLKGKKRREYRPIFNLPEDADLIQVSSVVASKLKVGTGSGLYPWWKLLNFYQKPCQERARYKFKRLVLVWHPDVNPQDPDATAAFQAILAAYEKSKYQN